MKIIALFLVVLILAGTACNLSAPRPAVPTDIFSTPVVSTPARTILPPTEAAPATTVPTAPPTSTNRAPTRRPATSAPPQPSGDMLMLQMYLVAIDDGGASGRKIGCNDSLVAVKIEVPPTQGVLRAALSKLLAVKQKDYGESGLYNALYQSDLAIESMAVVDGEAIIRLTGKLASGGVCDDPRIIAQIEGTALQFSTVDRVSIYVNGVLIQNLLSGRG